MSIGFIDNNLCDKQCRFYKNQSLNFFQLQSLFTMEVRTMKDFGNVNGKLTDSDHNFLIVAVFLQKDGVDLNQPIYVASQDSGSAFDFWKKDSYSIDVIFFERGGYDNYRGVNLRFCALYPDLYPNKIHETDKFDILPYGIGGAPVVINVDLANPRNTQIATDDGFAVELGSHYPDCKPSCNVGGLRNSVEGGIIACKHPVFFNKFKANVHIFEQYELAIRELEQFKTQHNIEVDQLNKEIQGLKAQNKALPHISEQYDVLVKQNKLFLAALGPKTLYRNF